MLEEQKELVQYRLISAKERGEVAKLLLDTKNYKDAISKSYYAMFTAVRAIMASSGIDFSKHSSVIAYFQREYIKTGIFDKKYSKYLTKAFQIRNSSDYDDFFIASKEDAKIQYNRMMELISEIENYLNKVIS